MKRFVAMAAIVAAGVLVSCKTHHPPAEVPIYPAVVGEKTDLYEVVSARELKLAPGVTFRTTPGPTGKTCGIVMLRQNGDVGGFMSCGCIGATSGNCITTSDNPAHPSCSGDCIDSEGNSRGCSLFGPIIGPPRDPYILRYRARPSGGS